METILSIIGSLIIAGFMVHFIGKHGGDVDESN